MTGCQGSQQPINNQQTNSQENTDLTKDSLVALAKQNSNHTFVELNGNKATFTESDKAAQSYIKLSELDSLGRTGIAKACLGPETLPAADEERGAIGMIKPSGWQTKRYDKSLVDGMYIYNRCHQIAWCLSGLNDDRRNLMTGTRSFNVDGMLPFENQVCDYIKQTSNHVLYESSPVFSGNELVARALHLQAYSIEDNGQGINFNVLIINKQDGIDIDYSSGNTELAKNTTDSSSTLEGAQTYILNTNTKKIHRESCHLVETMKPKNKKIVKDTKNNLEKLGYTGCKSCMSD